MKKPSRGVLRIMDLYRNSERRPGSSCWHWLGALGAKDGAPRIWTFDHDVGDKRSMRGAKAVWNIATGQGLKERIAYRACFSTTCVNPDHIAVCDTRKELAQVMSARGCFATDVARAARQATVLKAHAARGIVPTSPELVRQVRAATGTGRAIAASLGLSEQVVSRIRLGESHKKVLEAA